MNYLFFDIQITGHHSEYIDHLLSFLQQNGEGHQYYFLTHPDFASTFPEIALKATYLENVTLESISMSEWNEFDRKTLIGKSFFGLKLVQRYAKEFNAQHVLLLYFNFFQIALLFIRPKFTISGILFLQFYRMSKKGLSSRLKYLRKYWTTKLLLLNKKIVRIYVLNDEETASYLNKTFAVSTFKMLPDPIPQLIPLSDFDIFQHYNIPRENHILLHIGSLGDHKGSFEFLESAKYVDKALQSKLTYLLVGKGSKDRLTQQIEKIGIETDIQLIWDNQFVSNSMMKSLFDQCDAVVIPYKNSEASSGIMGHAAASGKAVIATGKGLLGELVRNYGLGVLVKEVAPEPIAEAIVKVVSAKMKPERAGVFVSDRTVHHFSEELITNC